MKEAKDGYKEVFDWLLDTMRQLGVEVDKPLKLGGGGETDLFNPMSCAVAFLAYIYTIEPPFYYYVNRACVLKDRSLLKQLGPYATAIYFMLQTAESERKDTIRGGRVIDKWGSSNLGWFAGSFIIFRGVKMT